MSPDRRLAPSPFPDDDGQACALTRARLAEVVGPADAATYLRAVAALCADRLLVPVIATATHLGQTRSGLASDKEAEMAVVMLQSADGRRAMLGFTGMDSLQTWRVDARPVPVTLDLAARTAQAEGATALLVDVAGPYPLAIDGEVLDQLALGHRLVETEPDGFGWVVTAADQGI